jgi:hypothetical protein
MDIDENIYRTNGFRILGLDITSRSTRLDNQINRINNYRERKNFNDNEPLQGVFKNSNMNFLLPVSPEPSYNEYQNAYNRLSDVEIRLIDEIFWFWPKTFDSDLDEEIVGYLKDGDYNKAISYWGGVSTSNTMNMTSIHNLAVLHHVRALDGFLDGKGNKDLFNDLELAFNYWSQTLSSNNFKGYVKERVNSLNDPRLTEEYVDKIFKELPQNLLNINVKFIKKHLDAPTLSKRKLDYISKFINSIKNSPFDSATIDKVSTEIIAAIKEPIKEKEETFKKTFEAEENQDKKFNLIFDFSDEVLPYVSILHDSFEDDTYSNNLVNSTCSTIYYKIPNTRGLELMKIIDTSNYNKFIELLKELLKYTTESDLKSKITGDLDELNESTGDSGSIKRFGDVDVTVKDEDGDNLDASVTFINSDTGKRYEKETGYSGSCTISDLPCGKYRYEVTKSGYETYTGTKTISENGNSLDVKLKREKQVPSSGSGQTPSSGSGSGSTPPKPVSTPKTKTSYNKKFLIFVTAIILASLAYYAAINFL